MAPIVSCRRLQRNFVGVVTAATACGAVAGFAALSAPTTPGTRIVSVNIVDTASIVASSTTLGLADSNLYFESTANIDKTLDEMQSIGVNSVRFMIPWAGVEPSNGVYNFKQIDAIVSAANARGISVIGLLDSTPGWAAQKGTPAISGPPASDATFAAFASKLATRYKGEIAGYEIWDEPNSKTFWSTGPNPAAYTALLKAAYTAIKAADPKAVVIAGALSSIGTSKTSMDPVTFLKDMYAAGAKGYFNELSFHPYSTVEFSKGASTAGQPLNELAAMRAVMVANGDSSKEIWATEYGLPTSLVGNTTQATDIKDFLTTWRTISYVGPEYIYSAQDDSSGTYGIWTASWVAKPAVAVIESFTGVAKTVKSMALVLTGSTGSTASTASGGQPVAGLIPTAIRAGMVVPEIGVTVTTTALSTGLGVAAASAHAVTTGLTQVAAALSQVAASAATLHTAGTVAAQPATITSQVVATTSSHRTVASQTVASPSKPKKTTTPSTGGTAKTTTTGTTTGSTQTASTSTASTSKSSQVTSTSSSKGK
jgi:hypothetical protein